MYRLLAIPALTLALPAQESMGALLGQARVARDEGRLQEALQAYDAMLRRIPAHETALLERAQVLAWAGRYDEALDGYRHFRALYPQRALEADLRSAQVHAWAGRTATALEILAPWVQGRHSQAILDDATYRAWDGQLPESLRRLDARLKERPGDEAVLLRRARFLSWTGRTGQARADYEAVLSKSPANAEALAGMARLHLWAGDPGKARGFIERIGMEDRSQGTIQVLEAQCEAAEGHPAQARRLLTPLLGKGASQREAREALDSLVDAEGCWAEFRHDRTDTNEGLRTEAPRFQARVPLGDGHVDLGLVRHRILFQDDARKTLESRIGLSYPLGSAWRGSLGLQHYSDIGGHTATGYSASLGFRPVGGLDLRTDYSRSLFTYTPSALDRGGSIRNLEFGATWTSFDGLNRLDGSVGRGELSAGSHRTSHFAAYERRFPWSKGAFRAGALVRGFDYSETLDLGFFNPERYRYRGFTGGASWRPQRTLSFDLDGRYGWQSVNGGDYEKAWGYALGVTWSPAGSNLTLNLAWSKSIAGLPTVEVADPAHYQEHTLSFGVRFKAPCLLGRTR